MSEIDTSNDYFVGVGAGSIVFLRAIPRAIGHDEALRLAAWIVSLADPGGDKFKAVLEAVQNT